MLNADGRRNRAGREWSAQMVHHVLNKCPILLNPTTLASDASRLNPAGMPGTGAIQAA